jgi:hypothetical protein
MAVVASPQSVVAASDIASVQARFRQVQSVREYTGASRAGLGDGYSCNHRHGLFRRCQHGSDTGKRTFHIRNIHTNKTAEPGNIPDIPHVEK